MPSATQPRWRVQPQRRLQQETPAINGTPLSNNTSNSQADNITATTTNTPGTTTATNDNATTSTLPLPACPFWATRVDGTPGLLDTGITQDTRDAAAPPLWYTDLVGVLVAANATNGSAPGAVAEEDVGRVGWLLEARAGVFAPLDGGEQEAGGWAGRGRAGLGNDRQAPVVCFV